MDDDAVLERLAALEIETPSWGYGNSGTRFHVYPWPGAARTVCERIDDAALVHRLTGCCPSVALHIPWDAVDDWTRACRLRSRARRADRRDQPEPVRRRRVPPRKPLPSGRGRPHARARPLPASASRSREEVGSTMISLWLADGTNYPARTTSRDRHARLVAGLEELYAALPPGMRLLVEYKFFEPGFYSTDLPDWGTAALVCRRLGPQAQVLVDTGHHPQGTNIEQIVGRCCSPRACSAASTSTTASTPTTT